MQNILHIDSSARREASTSRKLSQALVEHLSAENTIITRRDVSSNLPFVNELMVESYNTPPSERSDEHKQCIALSDLLVQELVSADTLVIGAPMYNFGPPACLKAWADLVARVGETFRYTEHGPVGLLENKKAYIVTVTGGAPLNSPVDFLTPWLQQFMKFLGIDDVQFIGAQALKRNADEAISNALSQIKAIKQA